MSDARRERVEAKLRSSSMSVGTPLTLVRVEPKVKFLQVLGLILIGAVLVLGSAAVAPWLGGVALIPAGGAVFWWSQRGKGGVADTFKAVGSTGWFAATPDEFLTLDVTGSPASAVARGRVRVAQLDRDHLHLTFEDGSERHLTVKEGKAVRATLAEALDAV